jgi:hypothetical protein
MALFEASSSCVTLWSWTPVRTWHMMSVCWDLGGCIMPMPVPVLLKDLHSAQASAYASCIWAYTMWFLLGPSFLSQPAFLGSWDWASVKALLCLLSPWQRLRIHCYVILRPVYLGAWDRIVCESPCVRYIIWRLWVHFSIITLDPVELFMKALLCVCYLLAEALVLCILQPLC